MSWQSTSEFLKHAGGGPLGPKKTIHVDTAKQPSAVEQTGGLLYQAEATPVLVRLAPVISCPNCGNVAEDISGAKQLYQIDVSETNGKSHKGDMPPCPVSSIEPPGFVYTIEPCGCRVNQEWAGAFAAELSHRTAGGTPRAVVDMTEKQRAAKLKQLEHGLSALYSLQACKNTDNDKEAIDYWIVVVADQIQRLCRGVHNTKPVGKPIVSKVGDWADKNGLFQPAVAPPKALTEGTPVYRANDGTVRPSPAYVGQQPCGVVQASPTFDAKSAVAAIKTMSYESFAKEILADWGNTAGQILGGWKPNPAQPDKPEIGRTKNGQWSVRYGDIYKVFVDEDKAVAYADSLMVLQPKFAEKMKSKPILQSAPVVPGINIFGGTTEEKAPYLDVANLSFKGKLEAILNANKAEEMSKDVLALLAEYTVSHTEACHVVMQSAFPGKSLSDLDRAELLIAIRKNLIDYCAWKNVELLEASKAFAKWFVNLVDIPEPKAKTQQPAVVGTPAEFAAPPPPPADPPEAQRHVKKKRTIRKIGD